MANFFKKRRKPTGPNKNEQKVMRGRETHDAPLGSRYPAVRSLSVALEFLGPQKQQLASETRTFSSNDELDLTVSCPGRCGTGSFNLSAKVAEVIESRQARSEASGICQEKLYAGAEEICGCELKAKIEAAYNPEPVEG